MPDIVHFNAKWIAHLNSLSLYLLPFNPPSKAHPTSVSLVTSFSVWAAQLEPISSVYEGNVNDTVILRGIKQVDDILATLMKTDTLKEEEGDLRDWAGGFYCTW